jgi:hypothetical protein
MYAIVLLAGGAATLLFLFVITTTITKLFASPVKERVIPQRSEEEYRLEDSYATIGDLYQTLHQSIAVMRAIVRAQNAGLCPAKQTLDDTVNSAHKLERAMNALLGSMSRKAANQPCRPQPMSDHDPQGFKTSIDESADESPKDQTTMF